MKAQRRFGLALSWPRITSAFLLDIVVLILASHLPVASGLARQPRNLLEPATFGSPPNCPMRAGIRLHPPVAR